jgi:hypothetical protein
VSADAPRDASTAQPHHAEHVRRPAPDNGPGAEQAPADQRADADRSRRPEHIPGRAEHNEARHAAPPLDRSGDAKRAGDGGRQGPAEAGARGAATDTDHHAGPAELQRDAGTGPRDRSSTQTPSRAEHNEARHARPPIEQAATTPPERRDDGYSWPPPQADRDSARALYREDFGAKAIADSARYGRDRGINVVGERPDKSPGDTSGLPPSGADLLAMEDKDEARGDRFRKKLYGEFDDVIDSEKAGVATVMDLTDRPPAGHPEVQVNSGPAFGPEIPQHATVDPSSITELVMVLGVVGFQTGRWMHHKAETLWKE